MKALYTVVTATAIGLVANPASAATFAFSFVIDEGGGITEEVMGQFVTENTQTTDPVSGFSGFEITSLMGTQDGDPISLLLPGNFRGNNNLFNPNEPFFDGNGVSYRGELEGEYQLYYNEVAMRYEGCGSQDCDLQNEPFTITNLEINPVPEPTSTLSLLCLGILGVGATLKRKVKSTNSIEKESTKVG